MPEAVLTRRDGVELARVGSWPTSTGVWDAKVEDFNAAIDALSCEAVRKPRLWIGHTDQRFTPRGGDGEPTIGWVENLRIDGDSLFGDYVGIPSWLDTVMASAYPDRSVEGTYNRRCALGHRHPFVLDGLALLGVTRPGVGVLAPLSDLDDVKALYGLAASEPPADGEVRVVAKFDPTQLRDGDGRWTDGAGGGSAAAPAGADKLGLAKRIKLGAGQSLAGSDVVSTDQGAIPAAAIRTEGGPRIRIGVGIADEDKRRWSAANRGGTADLDAGQVDDLRDALGGMFEAGATLRTQLKDLGQRERDLSRRERDLVRAQHPSLTKSQGKELDRLDERLPDLDRQLAAIDARERDRVERLPADLQTAWKNADPAERQRIIGDWHESQPEWRGLVRSLHGRDMQERERLSKERDEARSRRAELTAGREPLTAEQAADLAAVRQEIADIGDAYGKLDTFEGVVSGDWADLIYETHVDDGEVKYWLGVRPKGATDGESVPLTPGLIKKLDTVLDRLTQAASGQVRAAAEAHAGAMVALIPSDEDATRLAVESGEPADQLHVTLTYLGNADDLDAAARQDLIDGVSAAFNGFPVVEADAFALSVFNPPGSQRADGKQRDPCIVLGLSGDAVDAAHMFAMDALAGLESPKQHAPWHAHITLVYTDDLTRLAELTDRVGPVVFDRIRVALAGQHIDIPLIPAPKLSDEIDWDGAELVEAAADEGNLKRYWTRGEGLKRWVSSAHPWTTLYGLLKKHVGAARAKRIASEWFHDVFGYWPGDRRHRQKVAAMAAEDPAAPEATAEGGAPEPPAAEPDPSTEPKEDPVSTLSEGIRSRLGLADDADEAAALAAIDALKTQASTPPEPSPEQVAAAAAAEEKVAAAAAERDELAKEVKVLASQMETVTAELAAAKAEKAATVKASVLDAAIKDGKIAPAAREQWEKDYDEAPNAVARVLASIAKGTAVPVTVAGETGDPDVIGDDDAAWDREFARLFPAETSKEG